jgi:hypothetical protein
MDPKWDSPQKTHFHIHWTEPDRLDWQSFDSRREALTRALELAKQGEMFTIQAFSEPCQLGGSTPH